MAIGIGLSRALSLSAAGMIILSLSPCEVAETPTSVRLAPGWLYAGSTNQSRHCLATATWENLF